MKIDGLKIELRLGELGFTWAELARRSGLSRQNVSTIIRRGTCEPRTAAKLAQGLGVRTQEILREE